MSEQSPERAPGPDPTETAKLVGKIAEQSQRLVKEFLERQRAAAGEGAAFNVLDPGIIGTAFAELGGSQCGYCTPGILLTAKALLDREPDPSRERIREALSGNLCRCTGYLQILESVEQAARKLREDDSSGPEDPA